MLWYAWSDAISSIHPFLCLDTVPHTQDNHETLLLNATNMYDMSAERQAGAAWVNFEFVIPASVNIQAAGPAEPNMQHSSLYRFVPTNALDKARSLHKGMILV